jgi:hypothetical protein
MKTGRTGRQTLTNTRQIRASWAVLAVTVALVVVKLLIVGPVLGRLALDHSWVQELAFQILPVPFAVVGALIAARRPGHRIGWLLLIGTPVDRQRPVRLDLYPLQAGWRGLASRPRGHRVG